MRFATVRRVVLPFLLTGVCLAVTHRPAPLPAQARATAQAPAANAMAAVLQRNLSIIEQEFVETADAMPADRFSFAPSSSMGEFTGVRTFAQEVTHVAAVNKNIFAALLGEKAPDMGTNENGPASLKTKAEIMQYLRDSFAMGHRAMATINQKNAMEKIDHPFGPRSRLDLAMISLTHPYDHFGQMVEYLRMNHIIPPTSRPGH